MALALACILGLMFMVPLWLPRWRNARELARHRAALRALGDSLPIIMPVSGRPAYLAQVIAGLRGVADIAQTTLVFTQDERDPRVTALIRNCGLRHIHLRHTQPFFALLARSGLTTRTHCIGSNIFFGIEAVFKGSAARGVIVLEDDLVPSINFYRHFKWCFENIMWHPARGARVLSCGAYNRYSKGDIPRSEHHAFFRDKDYFSPWAWAIARDRWATVRRLWSFASWDSAMEKRVMRRSKLVNYRAVHSHVQCIGHHGVNGARRADCTYYTTDPVTVPIDYARLRPHFYEDGLPDAYWQPYAHDSQQRDPVWRSEWDTKFLPRVQQYLQRLRRRRAPGRELPLS